MAQRTKNSRQKAAGTSTRKAKKARKAKKVKQA